jgi:threonine/homoserine/homoserine lactone efflux protein
MTLPETALAILALLATPGPTNTLLALAGAERGFARATRLIPAELLGYLATTLPLAVFGSRLLDSMPLARTAITLAAAAWVLRLAVAMWRVPSARVGGPAVTARRVAVTTLLNPKALILGLVLLPAADPTRLGLNLGLFAAEVAGVAMMWALLGAALRRDAGDGLPAPWRRAASVWLGALAVYLLGRVAGLA